MSQTSDPFPGRNRLSVGCGRKTLPPDFVRLDLVPEVEPDVVWNLDQFPYPFPDNKFDFIECQDVIEHISDIIKTLEQFHRILKPGGVLQMVTPHYSSQTSWIDPTHRWHLAYRSFDYFCEGHVYAYYSQCRFRLKTRSIEFRHGRFHRSLMRRFANKWPDAYESHFAWIVPAWLLYFELEAVK